MEIHKKFTHSKKAAARKGGNLICRTDYTIAAVMMAIL